MFLGECLCLLPILARIVYTYLRQVGPVDGARKPLMEMPPDSGIVFTREDGATGARSPQLRYSGEGEGANQGATHAPSDPTTPAPPPEFAGRAINPGELDDDADNLDGETLSGRAIGLFWLPAFCDICGTTLMNVGLLFTPVSIYQ